MKPGDIVSLNTLPAYTIFRFLDKNRYCSSKTQVFQKEGHRGETHYHIHRLEKIGKAWKLENSGGCFASFKGCQVTIVEFRKHPVKEPEKTAIEKRFCLKGDFLHWQKQCAKLRSHVLGTHPKNMHPVSQVFSFNQDGLHMHARIFRCSYCGKTLIASKEVNGPGHWKKTSLKIVRRYITPEQLLDGIVLS